MKTTYVVQRWSQYKLGNAPLAHDKNADKEFDTYEEAEHYSFQADGGFSSDTRYRYKIVNKSN